MLHKPTPKASESPFSSSSRGRGCGNIRARIAAINPLFGGQATSTLVYVVKAETRAEGGHHIVDAATLAEDECYRRKETAVEKMLSLARIAGALERARAGDRPSPASLNIIPPDLHDAESIRVYTANGMVIRFFVDAIRLV